MEEHRMRVVEDRVLRSILNLKRISYERFVKTS
jgi:hypothetical protein